MHRHHHAAHTLPSNLPTHHRSTGPSRRVGSAAPWQGNDYARELFQGKGARYFVGADHLVVRATEAATILYTAAFFAPEIVEAVNLTSSRTINPSSRWLVNQMGGFGPATNRLFWSQMSVGGAAAVRYADEFEGQTLEMTPIGEYAVRAQDWYGKQTEFTLWAWKWLSTGFAEGTVGTARFLWSWWFSGANLGWS